MTMLWLTALVCNSVWISSLSSAAVSDAELLSIGNRLWDADVNSFSALELRLLIQKKTTPTSTVDVASQRLFSYVNETKFLQPTYSAFIKLLNNYNPSTGVTEPTLTTAEKAEVQRFLDAVLATSVSRVLYDFLKLKGLVSNSTEFRIRLTSLWFDFYPRSQSGPVDSSGFEHVFVGEKKSTSITGFHNWIRMYLLEKAGNINYMGYNYLGQPELMDIHLSWDGLMKDRASMFIGTSPEFDLSIYTLCMLVRTGAACRLKVGSDTFTIQTYDVTHKAGLQVASAYPMV